jgi:hypothetical protein
MKKFIYLHYGFTQPTPEIMEAWGKWFESIAAHIVDKGAHFPLGKEISHDGTLDLPLSRDSITGYNIIEAESMDKAVELAGTNPFIDSIRIYELMSEQ